MDRRELGGQLWSGLSGWHSPSAGGHADLLGRGWQQCVLGRAAPAREDGTVVPLGLVVHHRGHERCRLAVRGNRSRVAVHGQGMLVLRLQNAGLLRLGQLIHLTKSGDDDLGRGGCRGSWSAIRRSWSSTRCCLWLRLLLLLILQRKLLFVLLVPLQPTDSSIAAHD